MLGLVIQPRKPCSLAWPWAARRHAGPRCTCWWTLAAACLLVQVALFSPLLDQQPAFIVYGPWLYVLSLAGVLAVLLADARAVRPARLPLSVAALGVALNCLVIVANRGYMPRSEDAAASLGKPPTAQPMRERLVNVQPISEETRLAWLGDIIPQPGWLPLANVVSFGDLLLAGDLAVWAFRVTTASHGLSNSLRDRRAVADPLVELLDSKKPA
jgi:hypothetical protein